jgi:hypothetical protein
MGDFYLDRAISDLERNGLVAREDYLYFEATSFAMIGNKTRE